MDDNSANYDRNQVNEELIHALFAAASDGLIVVDGAGQLIDANAAACEMTGYTREALLHRSCTDLLSVAVKHEKTDWRSGVLYGENGRSLPVEIETRPLSESHLLLELRLPQTQPRIEKNLFQSFYENLAVGFWILDEDGRFLEVNEGYLAHSGYSRPELLEMGIGDVTIQGKPGGTAADLQNAGKQGYGLFETQHRKKNGEIWPVEISTTYTNGRFFNFARDITERKHLEDELRRKSSTLEKSLNGFDIVSSEGKFLYANQAYLTMWGYDSLDEILGTSPAGHCADPAVPERIIRNVEEKGEYTLEFTALRKDGSTFRVLMAVQKVVDDQGVVTYVGTSIDITEREQSRLALMKEHARMHKLLDTIPDMVWLKDPNGAYLGCNPPFEHMMGVKEDELLGKTDYEFFDKETADFFRRHDRNAVLAGKPTSNEEWITLADSAQPLLVETIKTPFFDDDGQLLGVLGIARNITEYKKVQAALQESQEQYQRLFDTMQRGVVYQAADGIILSMNPAAERILGKTKVEFLGETSESVEHDTLTEDGRPFPGLEHPSMVALRTGEMVRDVTMQVYNPREQQYRLISITAVPLFRDAETEPYQVYTIFDDVTERRQNQRALRESQERLAGIIDSAMDAIIGLDEDQRIILFNAAAEKMFGHPAADVIGRPHDMLLPERFRVLHRQHIHYFGLGSEPNRKYALMNTLWALHSDGREFPVEVSVSQVEIDGKKLFTAIMRDITGRLQAEEMLRKSEERFRIAVKNSSFIPAQFDNELRYRWIFNPHPDFDPAQVVGKRDDELEDSEGAKRLTALKRQVIESGVGVREEISFRRSDSTHIYDFTIEPLYDDTGVVIGGATAAFDITERKRAEQALYLMSDTQKQLAILNDLKAVYRLVGETVHKLTGDGYTITSVLDEDVQGMRIVSMHGFGRVYENLVQRFKIDPAKMVYPVADMIEEELRIYRSGHLERVEDRATSFSANQDSA